MPYFKILVTIFQKKQKNKQRFKMFSFPLRCINVQRSMPFLNGKTFVSEKNQFRFYIQNA